jgi:ribosomal protein S10
MEKHTQIDKSFIISNEDITLAVDYDDVDHKTVDKTARQILRVLNEAKDPSTGPHGNTKD